MDPQIFQFLEGLIKNNNREWFADHKPEFTKAKEDAYQFFDEMFVLLSEIDEFHEPKTFRIYRDVRFSKDKTPYKPHFSAVFSRKQPKNRGSFYIHLKPGNTFVASGFWEPNKEDLLLIRKAIERDDEFSNILKDEKLIENFGELKGDKLKLISKGFDKEHPRADLLKHKQFLFTKNYKDHEVFEDDFKAKIIEDYKTLQAFFHYMTEVLTTNENGESILD